MCVPFNVSALPAGKTDISVPYGDPALSGSVTQDGWSNKFVMSAATCASWAGEVSSSIDVYFAWSEKGLYVSGSVNQPKPLVKSTEEITHGAWDRFQISVNPNGVIDEGSAPCYFTVSVNEAGGINVTRDDASRGGGTEPISSLCKGAFSASGNNWQFTVLIPWSEINIFDKSFTPAAGMKIYANACFVNENGDAFKTAMDGNEGWNVEDLALTLNLAAKPAASASASSGKNPFKRMTATEDNVAGGTNGSHDTMDNPDALYDASKLFQLYWDTDSDTWHNAGVTIAFLAPYGIGYGHEKSVIYIENLDFGANGADKVTVALTNANEPFDGLGVYLDVNPVKDKNAKSIAVIKDVLTDGFEEDNAIDYTVDVNIPGGTHTVYFMYLGKQVGSLFSVQFNEAPPPAVAAPVAEAPAVDNTPAPKPVANAPKTGDISIIFVMIALSSAVVIFKKRKNMI